MLIISGLGYRLFFLLHFLLLLLNPSASACQEWRVKAVRPFFFSLGQACQPLSSFSSPQPMRKEEEEKPLPFSYLPGPIKTRGRRTDAREGGGGRGENKKNLLCGGGGRGEETEKCCGRGRLLLLLPPPLGNGSKPPLLPPVVSIPTSQKIQRRPLFSPDRSSSSPSFQAIPFPFFSIALTELASLPLQPAAARP